MATQNAVGNWLQKGVYQYTVSGLGSADLSSAMDLGNFTERTIQVDGTFQSAVLAVQGRMATDASWVALQTTTGGTLQFTATGVAKVPDNVRQIRLSNTTTVSTASDADNTNLKAYITLRSDR